MSETTYKSMFKTPIVHLKALSVVLNTILQTKIAFQNSPKRNAILKGTMEEFYRKYSPPFNNHLDYRNVLRTMEEVQAER